MAKTNKRNSFRTRQEGGAPLPLSEQLSAAIAEAPVEADGSTDFVKAWTKDPATDSVDTTGEDLGDVNEERIVPVTAVTRVGGVLVVESGDGPALTHDEIVAMAAHSSDPDYNADDVVAKIQEATAILKQPEEPEQADIIDISAPGVTMSEPEDGDKAIIWMLKNDLVKASRWATAIRNEPERQVYDLFSQEELEFTGIDFSGDDFATASAWALDKYNEWRATPGEEVSAEDEAEATAQRYRDLRDQYALPDNWTDSAIDEWIKQEGYNFGMTDRGNFVVDPTRFSERGIETYTTSELLDAIEGKLQNDYTDVEGAIANVYRQREAVNAAWSTRDLVDFLKQGLEPAKVSTGAWKNDVTRARRMAQDWTSQELQAWVKDEIKSGGETTDQKLAIEANKRFDLGVISVTPEDIRRVYLKIHSNAVKIVGVAETAVTPTNLQPEPVPTVATETVIPQGLTAMNVAYLKTQTERYAAACAPGKAITADAGAKEQRELDNLFRYILKIEDPAGFGNAMGFIRDFFKKNRDGLFNPQYAFRFTGTLRTEGDVQETHVNLLNILQVYTDENKSARKQIDLPYLLSKFPSNRQAWLLEFFQTYC